MKGMYIKTLLLATLLLSLSALIYAAPGMAGKATKFQHNTTQCMDQESCTACHINENLSESSALEVYSSKTSSSVQSSFGSVIPVGNYTVVVEVGQDWYQLGLLKDWPRGYPFSPPYFDRFGWIFWDDPNELLFSDMYQKNIILITVLDQNGQPVSGLVPNLSVTVDVPSISSGTTPTTSINPVNVIVTEYLNHPGTYHGYFYFSENRGDLGDWMGDYNIDVTIKGVLLNDVEDFTTTMWGCEKAGCHDVGHAMMARSAGCYLCHGESWYWAMKNPHETTQHIGIDCEDCHTPTVLINATVSESTVVTHEYDVSLMTGVHQNLSCEECHDRGFHPLPGGYDPSFYTVSNVIGDYRPEFTSFQEFQEHYKIDVQDSTNPLTVELSWPTGDDLDVYLYSPTWDKYSAWTFVNPWFYDGATLSKPETITVTNPESGLWILQVDGTWTAGAILNYTVKSTYPIKSKPIVEIPWNCGKCHNTTAAMPELRADNEVPSWDHDGAAFSHTDINNDSVQDVQCRFCHGSFHGIEIRNCQECHREPVDTHPISGLAFQSLSNAECIDCHLDPHNVTIGGGPDCVACHDIGKTNTNVNVTSIKSGVHANLNSNAISTVTLTDEVDKACWACHGDGSQPEGHPVNQTTPWSCGDCHTATGQEYSKYTPPKVTEHMPSAPDVQTNVTGAGDCKDCHKNDMGDSGGSEDGITLKATLLANVSHYAQNDSLMTPTIDSTNCLYCHDQDDINIRLAWGNAIQIFDDGHHGMGRTRTNQKCYMCHVESGSMPDNFHVEELTLGMGVGGMTRMSRRG